ncbi:MAG: hypothetical protein ABIN44_04560, partial [Burkholderiaceae bacterium]
MRVAVSVRSMPRPETSGRLAEPAFGSPAAALDRAGEALRRLSRRSGISLEPSILGFLGPVNAIGGFACLTQQAP